MINKYKIIGNIVNYLFVKDKNVNLLKPTYWYDEFIKEGFMDESYADICKRKRDYVCNQFSLKLIKV